MIEFEPNDQCQGHSDFEGLATSCKGAELSHMLLLDDTKKPYMGSQWHYISQLTLRDLERSKSRSIKFRSLISCKGPS